MPASTAVRLKTRDLLDSSLGIGGMPQELVENVENRPNPSVRHRLVKGSWGARVFSRALASMLANTQGREACRSAHRTANGAGIGNQPQDCEGARPNVPPTLLDRYDKLIE
jgi:hypothetical protein